MKVNLHFTNPNNKPYEAWLHWNVTSKCNLDCDYCFGHSSGNEKIYKIDIEKLISTLDKSNRIFRISFTGGEPFLIPNFVEACEAITEKHFLSLNTHLLSNRVKEFADNIDPKRILMFHASLHLEELKINDKWNIFSHNFHYCKSKGINIYAEAVAYPSFVNRINYYNDLCRLHKIEYTYGPFYGEYNSMKYPDAYSEAEINLFGLVPSEFNKFYQKGNLCNAGVNAGVVYPKGNIMPCFQKKETIGNIYEGIKFNNKIFECGFNYCGCPLNEYDRYLFNKAFTQSE